MSALRRKLYAMGAGALALFGTLALAGGAEIDPVRIIVATLVFVAPAVYLIEKSTDMYPKDVDIFEQFSMIVAGGLGILGLFVIAITLSQGDLLTSAAGALLFIVPAIGLYVLNIRRKTKTLA